MREIAFSEVRRGSTFEPASDTARALGRTSRTLAGPRLVLVEGPPGAGKTTTSALLAERLLAAGIGARHDPALGATHPIPTVAEPRARRYLASGERPEPPWLDEGAFETMVSAWEGLAADVARGDEVVVVDGTYLQLGLEYAFLCGASRSVLVEMQRMLRTAMRPAHTLLIHLPVTNIAAHLARVAGERPPGWAPWLGGFFALHPRLHEQAGDGLAIVGAFYEAWAPVEAALVARHAPSKLVLPDAFRDWDAAHRSIDAWLGFP